MISQDLRIAVVVNFIFFKSSSVMARDFCLILAVLIIKIITIAQFGYGWLEE